MPNDRNMTTFKIPMNADSTKKQELELLKDIQDAIPENSYLGELFTDELFEYVKDSMENDHPPNIIDELSHIETTNGDLETKLKNCQNEFEAICKRYNTKSTLLDLTNDKLEKEAKKLEQANLAIADLETRLEDQSREASIRLEVIADQSDSIKNLKENVEIISGVNLGFYEQTLEQLHSIEDLKLKIVYLKSELYDVITGAIKTEERHEREMELLVNADNGSTDNNAT